MQLDLFGAIEATAVGGVSAPIAAGGAWKPPEVQLFDEALRRKDLAGAVGILNRLKTEAAQRILLASGFSVTSSHDRAQLMRDVQSDLIEAARLGLTGGGLREFREQPRAVEGEVLPPESDLHRRARELYEDLEARERGEQAPVRPSESGAVKAAAARMAPASQDQFPESPLHQAARELVEELEAKEGSKRGVGAGVAGEVVRPEVGGMVTARVVEQAVEAPGHNTDDAGEELTYNRRNRVRSGIRWADLAEKNPTLQVKETTKANVYPRPDYDALIAGGMQPMVAHLVKQVYDSIAAKPAFNGPLGEVELRLYIDGVHRVMDGVMTWSSDRGAVAKWVASQAKSAGAMLGRQVSISDLAASSAGAASLLETVYPDGWRNHRTEIRITGGNKMLGALQPGYDEVRRALKAIDTGWPSPQEAWQKQGFKVVASADALRVGKGHRYKDNDRIDVHYLEAGGRIYQTCESAEACEALKATFKPWLLLDKAGRIQGQFDLQDQATEAAREATRRKGKGPDVDERGIDATDAVRTGVGRRSPGESISSDQLIATFGFKGVNFGNWMKGDANAAERQMHLNYAFDSFLDLAEVLGVPPKAMSLNGMLGLAFGAQGNGNFAAHFVPGVNEINLTRYSGAGSLAHEFGHAVDHYFAVVAGLGTNAEPFLTEHVNRSRHTFEELRPQIRTAFAGIVKAMNKRDESPEEAAERVADWRKGAQERLEKTIKYVRKDFAECESQFDELADRLRKGDLGDGYVALGRNSAVSPVVAEIRNLYKATKGRVYSIDNLKILENTARSVAFTQSAEHVARSHEPQSVTTEFASNAARLDRQKGGKPYWSTDVEKFARAFDAFVSDSLQEREAMNSYLSHAGREGDTVPMGAERVTINNAFKDLVKEIRTRETERGTALYSRERSLFSPDSFDANNWALQVNRLVEMGQVPRAGEIPLGDTPAVLRALGAPALQLKAPASVIHKATRPELRGHDVKLEDLRRLPALMADPLMVFDSATESGSLVALVAAQDKSNRPVIVAVQLEADASGWNKINKINSVYGRDRVTDIDRWVKQGLLRYYDKEKAPQWLHAVGLQLPEANTIERLNKSLVTKTDIVNSPLYSTGGAAAGVSRDFAEKQVLGLLGEKAGRALLDAEVITLVDNQEDLRPGPARLAQAWFSEEEAKIKGATFGDGTVEMVLENLREEDFRGVAQHEFFHSAAKDWLGEESYSALMKRLQQLREEAEKEIAEGEVAKDGSLGSWFAKARAAVPPTTPAADMLEEIAGYAIEQHVSGTEQPAGLKKWVGEFMSALRVGIIRHLGDGAIKDWALEKLQPEDLSRIAICAMRSKGSKIREAATGELQREDAIGENRLGSHSGGVAPEEVVCCGRHSGVILAVKGDQVIQSGGRGKQVTHEVGALDRIPAVGAMVEIRYSGGRGVVEQREASRGMSR